MTFQRWFAENFTIIEKISEESISAADNPNMPMGLIDTPTLVKPCEDMMLYSGKLKEQGKVADLTMTEFAVK